MQGDIEITSYDLIMVLQAQVEAGRISGDPREMMRSPLSVDTEEEHTKFASAHDQLILTIAPSSATLTDVSGEWPTRSKFTKGLSKLLAQLLDQSVSVPAYGWNIEGTLRNLDNAQVIGGLFDQPRVDRILGGDTEPLWFPPQIDFMSDSTFSDRLTLRLRHDNQKDETETLHFEMFSYFKREIVDADGLEKQGQEFTRHAEGILARLVD